MKSNLLFIMSFGLFVAIAVSNVEASIQTIASITNDEDKGVIKLVLITDKNEDVSKLKIIFKDENNKVTDTDTYTAQEAADGVILYELDGREVVNLKSVNFSSHQGGVIELDFLYNGITGSRGLKKLDLSRDGDKWSLKNLSNNKSIRKMHFVSNKKMIVGTIGIKRIEVK